MKATLLLAISAILFSFMGALIKILGNDTANTTIVFFRNFIGLLYFLPFLLLRSKDYFKTEVFNLHLLRAGFGLAAMYLFFYALATINIADAMLFTYSAPIFIPLIAWLALAEKPTTMQIIAALIGFAGVWLILQPPLFTDLFSFDIGDIKNPDHLSGYHGNSSSETLNEFSQSPLMPIIALGTALFAASAFVCLRKLGRTEPAQRTVFYFTLISTAISLVPFVVFYEPLSMYQIGLLTTVGIIATFSQVLMSKAYALAPAAQIGPVAFLAIPVSGAIGWYLWDDQPDLNSVIGAILVFGAILLTMKWKNGVKNA